MQIEPLGEPLERPGDLRRVAGREESHVPRGECLADDRGALEQLAIGQRQLLQAGADHPVQRERNVARDAERARAGELDDVERVAFRPLDARRVGAAGVSGERPGRPVVQGVEREEEAVAAGAQPALRRQLWTRGRHDQKGHLGAQREAIEQLDDLAIRPVEILDPQDDRARAREDPEVAAPAVDDLVLALARWQARQIPAHQEARAVPERGRHPLPLRDVRQERCQARLQRLDGRLVILERQQLSEQAPRLRFPGGATPRLDDTGLRAEPRDELLDQAGLSLAGRTGNEGKDAAASSGSAVDQPEEREVALAPHEGHAALGGRPAQGDQPPGG